MVTDGSRSMPGEVLSLKWNKHNSTFLEVLSILRDQESFVDVTLACGGKLYPAHKFILSTCSDYFREMFNQNPCKHPIIYMNGVSTGDLEALLDFMYRGEVDVERENLKSLMETAIGLQIKGLAMDDNNSGFKRETIIPPPTPPPRQVLPEPSTSPPPKRKRYSSEYLPGALNMFNNYLHHNPSATDLNSPYDLSQKPVYSNPVSQSKIPAHERPNSTSHPEKHSQNEASSPDNSESSHSFCRGDSTPTSMYNNKENTYEEMKRSMMSPNPRTPQPSSSSGSETHTSRDDNESLPGPSGTQGSPSDDDLMAKEDIKVDDNDYGCDAPDSGINVDTNFDSYNTDYADSASEHALTSLQRQQEANLEPPNDIILTDDHDLFKTPPLLQDDYDNNTPDEIQATYQNNINISNEMIAPRNNSLDSPNYPIELNSLNCPIYPIELNSLRCPICYKDFKVIGSLRRHYRSHINFKPYECEICSKKFTLNQYLIEHRRIHTGEKPFSCDLCEKKFAQTGTLYHHMRNVHHTNWNKKNYSLQPN